MSHPELKSSLPVCGSSAVSGRVRFVDIRELSHCLGISVATAYSDLSRAPWKLPAGYRLPGRRKLLWDPDEVAAWVKRFPDRNTEPLSEGAVPAPRRRGRPHKLVGARGISAGTSSRTSGAAQ